MDREGGSGEGIGLGFQVRGGLYHRVGPAGSRGWLAGPVGPVGRGVSPLFLILFFLFSLFSSFLFCFIFVSYYFRFCKNIYFASNLNISI